MRTTLLPSKTAIPILGQGTWFLGDEPARRQQEIAALRAGIDAGMTLIDTAEMYGDGASERLVGEAIRGLREKTFIVSKVLPHNASRRGTVAACERSLQRMGIAHIDLYLLHWRGGVPLEETLAGFDELQRAGKIRHWGVSNFDADDLAELDSIQGGDACSVNQVLYNLTRRGVEFDLLPLCEARRMPVMAYSPVEQGRLLRDRTVRDIAERLGKSPAQVALAWVLRRDGVIAIPKASSVEHVLDNRAALDLQLTQSDLDALDRAFPPPRSRQPLEMI
ncbi:aldo/keto reductase [Noviherbaspirillum pedocola]|uniref:Aldo/keto reductase n=1 Tax=Noviherbaspirillum pedocola TaxID=2801341 RepID=A0A934W8K8_9BURK|nr:aldo/keto reductase [Noviherbaspirillum pedocola]MBK4737695.1 aldo/keto reductase [Noviherbaspirillum pedocola]